MMDGWMDDVWMDGWMDGAGRGARDKQAAEDEAEG